MGRHDQRAIRAKRHDPQVSLHLSIKIRGLLAKRFAGPALSALKVDAGPKWSPKFHGRAGSSELSVLPERCLFGTKVVERGAERTVGAVEFRSFQSTRSQQNAEGGFKMKNRLQRKLYCSQRFGSELVNLFNGQAYEPIGVEVADRLKVN